MFPEMHSWIQSIIKNMKLTDYRIGTVIQLNPMKIDFGENDIITDTGTNIILTENVIEKKITLEHKHSIDGSIHDTSNALKTYIINEGIKVNDALLILMVADGQKFIVLSKSWDTNSIVIS